MNQFIIDLGYMFSKNDKDEMMYYIDRLVIPVNSIYILHYKPYYINLPYKFRDFYCENDFKKLLNNKVENKPKSFKSYNMGVYYISNRDKGYFVKNEIIPVKVDMFNILNYCYYIKEIYTFSLQTNSSIYRTLSLNLGSINSKNKKKIEIKFIVDDMNRYNERVYIRWVPINNIYINILDYYEIDISDFVETIDLKNIHRNIMIVCNKKI